MLKIADSKSGARKVQNEAGGHLTVLEIKESKINVSVSKNTQKRASRIPNG